jgi:molybdopterin converting factor small subunit
VAIAVIPRRLQSLTQGRERVEVAADDAPDIRGLLAALERQFPGLGERLRDGVAVSIDGEIVNAPLLEPLEPDSEVHFLPAVSGGR